MGILKGEYKNNVHCNLTNTHKGTKQQSKSIMKLQKRINRFNKYEDEHVLHNKSEIFDENNIILEHSKCGELINTTYDFLMQNGFVYCTKCEIENKTNIFKQKLKVKYKNYNEFEVLGNYINITTFIKMKHKKCGHVYETQPKTILNKGLKCPICCNKNKKTTQKYKVEVFNLTKGKFLVLGEYIDYKTKILIKRVKCQHVFQIKPSEFLKNPHCPVCLKKEKALLKHKKLVIRFNKKFKGEYEIVTQIYNSTGVVDLLHKKCGHLFTTAYKDVMNKNAKMVCPKCRKETYEKTLEWRKQVFLEKAYTRWGDEYSFTDDYKSLTKEILVKHNKCNHEFSILPSQILQVKKVCPLCDDRKIRKK